MLRHCHAFVNSNSPNCPFGCSELVLLRAGRVLAAGPIEHVLTAENIRSLYQVDVEVARHPRTGRLTVVPLARAH